MKQILSLVIGILFFMTAALAQVMSNPTPHQDDRYRGRDDSRSGNRLSPEHEPTPAPTATNERE